MPAAPESTYLKRMDGEVDAMSELAARVRALNVAFEETAFRALLPPLLDLELTVQQLKVLTVLVSAEDGTTGARLAAMFDVSMASMSRLLDRLEAQGMTQRTVDRYDARSKRITATQLGRGALRSLIVRRPELSDEVLLQLEAEDLRALLQGMEAVAAILSIPGPGHLSERRAP